MGVAYACVLAWMHVLSVNSLHRNLCRAFELAVLDLNRQSGWRLLLSFAALHRVFVRAGEHT